MSGSFLAPSYRNRLTSAGNGLSTTTYGYMFNDQRAFAHTSANATTTYPTKFFEKTSITVGASTTATTTAYLFAGSDPIATIQGNGLATTTSYIHSDHLGSMNDTTDPFGVRKQTMDYYPYGAVRINNGTPVQERTFIGQFSDATGLDYLNARYYDASRGQFISQDPVFTGDPRKQVLTDPQSLNSYSYANGNPIVKSDPSGQCAGPAMIACVAIIGAGISSYATYASDVLNNRANPAPGLNPYLDNLSSPAAYAVGAFTCGASLAFLQEYRLLAAGLSFVTSVKQDDLNGRPRDYQKALVNAGLTLATGVSFDAAIAKAAAKTLIGRVANETVSSIAPLTPQAYSANRVQNPPAWTGGGVSGIPNNSGLPATVRQSGVNYVRNSSGLLNLAK